MNTKMIRVYKFLSCQYGLLAIKDKRLKVAEVQTLNDPFELQPFDLSNLVHRGTIVNTRNFIAKKYGFLCFSYNWQNPVLWSHYADSHKGLCLGFDVREESGRPITYAAHPKKIPESNIDFRNVVASMQFTKYDSWRYEEEFRVLANIEDKLGGHQFCEFDRKLRLREIIVGVNCPLSRIFVVDHLGIKHLRDVKILKAKLALDAFKILEDENGLD